MTIDQARPGDPVIRWFSNDLSVRMTVTAVDPLYIYIGKQPFGWKFDRFTGYEVDEDLGWGVGHSGSIITFPNDKGEYIGND